MHGPIRGGLVPQQREQPTHGEHLDMPQPVGDHHLLAGQHPQRIERCVRPSSGTVTHQHYPTARMSSTDPVDLGDTEQLQLAIRIGSAWIELRRGASMSKLREYLFGSGDDALEQGQMDTLDLLAQHTSIRMSDLADALRVDPSTATRAVQRLVNVGLASRMSCNDDGRVVKVSVTPAGRERHADVDQRRSQVMTFVLGGFAPAEREQLAELLERYVGRVDDFVTQLNQ